jgi:hypothetical protein
VLSGREQRALHELQVPARLRPPLVPGHAASTHSRRREWLAHHIERIAEVE